MVVPYKRHAFQEAVRRITDVTVNAEMRRAAFLLSQGYSDNGAAEWIWNSLTRGEPVDRRYEELMPRHKPDLSQVIRRIR